MKTVLPLISARRKHYELHPFIRFLRDGKRPAEQRLSFAPYVAHFVFAFADFNRTFLRVEGTDLDWIQQAVNTHAQEDGKHWAWYLQDLSTLGYNPSCSFTDSLRFLWGDSGRQGRAIGYSIISAIQTADPTVRIVAIEALESMGIVALEAIWKAANEHPLGDKLIYFGQHHLARETGHAIGGDHERILNLVLSDGQRKQATAIINEFYDRMEAFNTELLRLVEAAPKAPGDAFLRANREGLSAASSRGSEARPA